MGSGEEKRSKQSQSESEPAPSSSSSTTSVNKTDNRCSRSFNSDWFSRFPWLVTETDSTGAVKMYCKVCRHAGSKNAFTKGCTDFQSSALQRRRELGKHKDALKLAPEQKLMLGQSEQKKDIDATKQNSLIRTVLYMTKRQLPDVEFHSLVDLQKANGCTSLSTGQIYTNHSSITEMKASLKSVVREQQQAIFNRVHL